MFYVSNDRSGIDMFFEQIKHLTNDTTSLKVQFRFPGNDLILKGLDQLEVALDCAGGLRPPMPL